MIDKRPGRAWDLRWYEYHEAQIPTHHYREHGSSNNRALEGANHGVTDTKLLDTFIRFPDTALY